MPLLIPTFTADTLVIFPLIDTWTTHLPKLSYLAAEMLEGQQQFFYTLLLLVWLACVILKGARHESTQTGEDCVFMEHGV